MKTTVSTLIISLIILLLSNCDNSVSNEKKVTELSSLNNGDFNFKVKEIALNLHIQNPSDTIPDSCYQYTDGGNSYFIQISASGDSITFFSETLLEPIKGYNTSSNTTCKLYNLTEGLFAGGQFKAFIDNDVVEAELTIYGSGVPIIKSERGYLTTEY